MIRRTLYEAALVILITLGLSAAAYVIRPHVLSLWPTDTVDAPAEENGQLYHLLAFDRAVSLFNQQTALFADARPMSAYDEGHIQGAVHLDPYRFDEWSESLVEKVPPEKIIITYCEGDQCALSTDLAEKLTWLGFEQVFYLKDGWGQWKQHQLPIARKE